jgi:CelD/BcsL family acetyltransferase involved in cellulose biosynthesis
VRQSATAGGRRLAETDESTIAAVSLGPGPRANLAERRIAPGYQTNLTMDITFSKVTDFERLGEIWRDLERRADASFFQSWAWTGCLAQERFTDPVLFSAREGGRVVALALFNHTRPSFGQSILWLGESGDPRCDDIFIEHNGILIERGFPKELLVACLDGARHAAIGADRRRYRGIRLSGVDEKHLTAARLCYPAVRVRMMRPVPFVELDSMRRSGTGSLEVVSRNTRYQIRRSERLYAATGPLTVARAQTIDEAQFLLTELIQLHQTYWVSRGKPGAFANPKFKRFHHTLIERTFANGQADLLRVTAGGTTVGYLYNFLYRGHVCAYQSGFNYRLSSGHYKPGLTCHHLAIEMYLAKGALRYDFLAGAERYKLSFATATTPLYWIAIGQTRLSMLLEKGFDTIKYRISNLRW